MLILKEASSRFIGDLIGAEDGVVLKEGIEVLDELLCSDFSLTKAVLISLLPVLSIAHPSHNRACYHVGLQVILIDE